MRIYWILRRIITDFYWVLFGTTRLFIRIFILARADRKEHLIELELGSSKEWTIFGHPHGILQKRREVNDPR